MSSQQHEHKKLGFSFIIAMWLLVFALVFFLFDNVLQDDYNPNQNVITDHKATTKEVTLQRNRYGHYVTEGQINGQVFTFLLDTGASDISIPYTIAKKLNLQFGQERQYQTANGIITGYLTKLDSVKIGDIELKNVRASINPKMPKDEILLGMSFLKHIEFTQRGDTLILRQ